MAQFRWIDWNLEHIAQHGVTTEEAEWAISHPVTWAEKRRIAR